MTGIFCNKCEVSWSFGGKTARFFIKDIAAIMSPWVENEFPGRSDVADSRTVSRVYHYSP